MAGGSRLGVGLVLAAVLGSHLAVFTNAQTGACCTGADMCQDGTTAFECGDLMGDYQGDDTMCADITCTAPESGACCLGSVCTDAITETRCTTTGGTFQGPDSLCTDTVCVPPMFGCCCTPSGNTGEPVSVSTCDDLGGVIANGGACSEPSPCGACCLPSGECTSVGLNANSECQTLGGTYLGAATVCSGPNTCPQAATGACCLLDGSCEILTESECGGFGGAYEGDDSVCDPSPCGTVEPTGACCLAKGKGTCETVTEPECTASGGEYEGDNTVCETVTCPAEKEKPKFGLGSLGDKFDFGKLGEKLDFNTGDLKFPDLGEGVKGIDFKSLFGNFKQSEQDKESN